MKQTAVQQAIAMVRSRMESMNDTLMGKHTVHHLQQVERELYDLLKEEKEQIEKAWWAGHDERDANHMIYPSEDCNQYYKETYE